MVGLGERDSLAMAATPPTTTPTIMEVVSLLLDVVLSEESVDRMWINRDE